MGLSVSTKSRASILNRTTKRDTLRFDVYSTPRSPDIARGFRRPVRQEPPPEINGRLLKYRDLRIIDDSGAQRGVMSSRDALAAAQDAGLDLVLVTATSDPPVAKIIDFGKHKYLEGKAGKDKKKSGQETKGIKISPRIAEHDLGFLIKNALRFLDEGDKVRVTCMFRQRELTHPELGLQKLAYFAEKVAHAAVIERPASLDGRQMIMILNPRPGVKKKDAKAENEQDGGEALQSDGNGEDNPPSLAQQPPVPPQA
ncbi:MAG: translation initiation factor IF-3 [Armatimonadota bacterium]